MKDLIDSDEASRATTESSLATAPKYRDPNVSSTAFIATDPQEKNPAETKIVPKTSTSDEPTNDPVAWFNITLCLLNT